MLLVSECVVYVSIAHMLSQNNQYSIHHCTCVSFPWIEFDSLRHISLLFINFKIRSYRMIGMCHSKAIWLGPETCYMDTAL